MSNYIYVTKEDKLKALSTYKNHKSLFEIVEFQSVGRWKIKPKRQDENDILYLLYKIQNYCLENKLDTYLTTLKVKCLCSYILLYDSDEDDYKAVFNDLNIQPYGFFYSSIERFLKKTTYFDNSGVVDVIISPEKVKNKELIDLKFDKVLSKNKEVFSLTLSDFIESMRKESSYTSYYKKTRRNEFYTYDIPFELQKYFKIDKQLNNKF